MSVRRNAWMIIGLTALGACSADRAPSDAPPADAQPAADSTGEGRAGWELVWQDEFDDASIDESKWRIEHAAVVKNQELQYYLPDEVYTEQGNLVIRSQKRTHGEREYTSGLVDTQERFSQAYGRFEVRARLPKGQGIWPSHWMLPDDHPSWPPEIDIMELLGHEPDTVHMTQHWGTWPQNAHEGGEFVGPDFSEGFHVFAVEWSPDRIDWFVDGDLKFSRTGDIPRIPFYIILNTAVGGEWPGNPDETTEFPQFHYIDYVRVYRRAIPGRTLLSIESRNGSVRVEPDRYDFDPSETARLSASPDFGFVFDGWDGVASDGPAAELDMSESRAIAARFAPDPALGERLTVAAAEASSVETDGLEAINAADGLPGTRWASESRDPQTLTLDLGSTATVNTARVLWEVAHARLFHVETSLDGSAWTRRASVEKRDRGDDVVEISAECRYVRLICETRATQWGNSIWEVELYGSR